MKKLLIASAVLLAVIAALYAYNAYVARNVHVESLSDPYAGWSEATMNGVTFRYPGALPTSYVSAAEWPPLVERVVNEYSCNTEVQGTDGPVPEREEKVISGTTYCVSRSSEGAAGSIYVTYEYAKQGMRMMFTLRYPQCMNYDQPQQGACQLEQQSVDIDILADRILSSAR